MVYYNNDYNDCNNNNDNINNNNNDDDNNYKNNNNYINNTIKIVEYDNNSNIFISLTHILRDSFTGTKTIVSLLQWGWSNAEYYEENS